MKKYKMIIALALSCICVNLKAQNIEGIIHTVFQPDSMVYIYSNDTLRLDFNKDGNSELVFYFESTFPFYRIVDITSSVFDSTWMWTLNCTNDWASPYETPLSFLPYHKYYYNWSGYYDEYEHYHIDSIMHGAVKYTVGNDIYYGWFLAYTGKIMRYMAVKEMAFCTIPNYPLKWGQTNLTGIEENGTFHNSKLHPNPTTGIVRIEGEKAIEVQVFNALGQLLKTVQNTNEVSLEGLPQGVYLLRVTLEGGKVFSDKVVKE